MQHSYSCPVVPVSLQSSLQSLVFRSQWKMNWWKGLFLQLLKDHLGKTKEDITYKVGWKKLGEKNHINPKISASVLDRSKKKSASGEYFNQCHIQDSHLAPGSLEKTLPSCTSFVRACTDSFVCFLLLLFWSYFLPLWIDSFSLAGIWK